MILQFVINNFYKNPTALKFITIEVNPSFNKLKTRADNKSNK